MNIHHRLERLERAGSGCPECGGDEVRLLPIELDAPPVTTAPCSTCGRTPIALGPIVLDGGKVLTDFQNRVYRRQ